MSRQSQKDTITVGFGRKEIPLIIAALRAIQEMFHQRPGFRELCEWELLSFGQIDELCERFNLSPETRLELDPIERSTVYFALLMWQQWSAGHLYKVTVTREILGEEPDWVSDPHHASVIKHRLRDVIHPVERDPLSG